MLRHRRSRKVIVYKMQRKKKTRKKKGHRQHQTRLLIESISLDGTVLAAADQRTIESFEPIDEIIVIDEPATPEPVATVE